MRVDSSAKVVGVFSGCNDLVASVKLPEELVSFSLGGIFVAEKKMKRLGGKALFDNVSSRGAILNMSIAEFQNQTVLIVHTTNKVLYETSSAVTILASSGRVPNNFGAMIDP